MSIQQFLESVIADNTLVGAKKSADIFVHEYVRPEPGMRVLDIGCGNGRLAPYFKDTDYTGIDSSTSCIDNARKAYPWANFICSDITTEPLPDGSADLGVIYSVLHHLDDTQCSMLLKVVSHVLVPSGTLVVIEPCYVNEQSGFVRWMFRNDRGQYVRWENQYKDLLAIDFTLEGSVIRHDLLNIPYTHGIFRAVPRA